MDWDTENKLVKCTIKSDIDQNLTLIERSGMESLSGDAAVNESPLGPIAKIIILKAGASTRISIKVK
jgi:alpha-L-fucosidase 2